LQGRCSQLEQSIDSLQASLSASEASAGSSSAELDRVRDELDRLASASAADKAQALDNVESLQRAGRDMQAKFTRVEAEDTAARRSRESELLETVASLTEQLEALQAKLRIAEKRVAKAKAAEGGGGGGGGGGAAAAGKGSDSGSGSGATESSTSSQIDTSATAGINAEQAGMPDLVQSTLLRILWDAVHTHRTLPNGRVCNDLPSFFAALDADDSGKISGRELQAAIESMDVWLSVSQLKWLLGLIDTDHDGSIMYTEFERWMMKGSQLLATESMDASASAQQNAALQAKLMRSERKRKDDKAAMKQYVTELRGHLATSELPE